MSTALQRTLQPITAATLDAVVDIEQRAYPFPWTRGNFIDSLAAGYEAQMLRGVGAVGGTSPEVLGYFLAMEGVDEMHLLNIAVDPRAQGQGHARWMLDQLVSLCRRRHAPQLWLEVRPSNTRAKALYDRYGFEQVGRRKDYYPAGPGQREDAIVMVFNLPPDAAAPAREVQP
jgi:ribosomal-protein-alanine N-acetyltransferase